MDRALTRGETARRRTAPNPWVGAIVVRDGEIVGQGATQPPGGAHAEIEALREAGDRARGATVYTTLEPCSHQGRTGPCVVALAEAGVGRVVVALEDPDPLVAGRGVAQLRELGITVDVGIGTEAAGRALAPYLLHRRAGRAFTVVKTAMSLDGRIAARDGSSQWITGAASRADAHRLRAESQAIVIGAGTALADTAPTHRARRRRARADPTVPRPPRRHRPRPRRGSAVRPRARAHPRRHHRAGARRRATRLAARPGPRSSPSRPLRPAPASTSRRRSRSSPASACSRPWSRAVPRSADHSSRPVSPTASSPTWPPRSSAVTAAPRSISPAPPASPTRPVRAPGRRRPGRRRRAPRVRAPEPRSRTASVAERHRRRLMFTGIVEELGSVRAITPNAEVPASRSSPPRCSTMQCSAGRSR